jgi:hypothetical protein
VLKLAKSWKDISRLLNTLKEAINGVSNASVILLIIVFIFTLLGMQLFGGRFTDAYDGVAKFEGDDPRHHFDNIFWAFTGRGREVCVVGVFVLRVPDKCKQFFIGGAPVEGGGG